MEAIATLLDKPIEAVYAAAACFLFALICMFLGWLMSARED